jgi:hypothetical protein
MVKVLPAPTAKVPALLTFPETVPVPDSVPPWTAAVPCPATARMPLSWAGGYV